MNKRCKTLLVRSLTYLTLAITALLSPQPASAGEAPVTLRVATWNIDSKAHPDIAAMRQLLREQHIEIIGLQELDVNNNRNAYDMLQAFCTPSYPYAHFAKGRDFADGAFGVGVLSQYPLLEQSSLPLESTGSRATKALERVVFEKAGKRIALYNTHLSWENLDLRRRQIKQVIDCIEADPIPYKIVTADFNTDQHPYEFAMFQSGFILANGHNGQWFDTYNANDDPSMKVFTIDNIIATKNIRLTHAEMVAGKLSDHNLLLADFELLDPALAAPPLKNLALGQAVSLPGTTLPAPYELVDNNPETLWQSTTAVAPTLVLELDKPYQLQQLILHWGAERLPSYTIATSVNGREYQRATIAKSSRFNQDRIPLATIAKFIKLTFTAPQPTAYALQEIEVRGITQPSALTEGNHLINGTMETATANQPDNWQFALNQDASPTIHYTAEADTTMVHNGRHAIKLTRTALENSTAKNSAALRQTVSLQPNMQYQLSFWHKTDTLHSNAFTCEIEQKDPAGQNISTHYAKLTDNLNMSSDWRQFRYNFKTAPTAAQATIALHIGAGSGSLWLDDLEVREVIPTQALRLSAMTTHLKPGETLRITAASQPPEANDLTWHWVSSNPAIASVDSNGNVTAHKSGTAYVGLQNDSDLTASSALLITVK